jgi:transcriptional regulator with XRE-family HTH domain
MSNPTIQRRRLGIALKQARERAGKTRDEAAEIIDARSSKISRIELGQSSLRLTDLGILCDFYNVDAQERDVMREMARAGRQRGRWNSYRSSLPTWFRQYIDLEGDATELRWYQAEIIPGILQTEAYVRGLYGIEGPTSADEDTERQVRIRLERQTIVDEPTTELSFILSESALRRVVGSPATMRDQLRHLAKLSSRPNVHLQVLPFDAQTYTISSYAFIVMRFDEAASDVIYVEDFTDANYLDRLDDVKAYTRLWDLLSASALGAVESRRLINRVAGEFGESEP